MKPTNAERRINREFRVKVSAVSMRLGIPQREAYRLINEKHLKNRPIH